MKLVPSDPDVQTLLGRIRRRELDLQPDFQRGEVWSREKKRRLIDTILRDWHVPPIHVIEHSDSYKQEVLDGQQRLAAIRDFVDGVLRVDGTIEPFDPEIYEAHNCTYDTLPSKLRRRFDRFAIRVFSLTDFRPDEPSELFFRLNQPVSLTAAEQRNAFFGPVREQVKMVCEQFPKFGITDDFLGFSNSRMAFDDIVAKLCVSLERRSLREKITASTMSERYRSPEPFPTDIISRVERTLQAFGSCRSLLQREFKFNKATVFSWLCFTSRLISADFDINLLDHYIWSFETSRANLVRRNELAFEKGSDISDYPPVLLRVFSDRSSLRVADVSSVILRDAVLAYCYAITMRRYDMRFQIEGAPVDGLVDNWRAILNYEAEIDESALLYVLDEVEWGAIL